MAWLKIDANLIEHPKLLVMVKDLRLPPVQLQGHLVALWQGTMKLAEDGDLSRFSDDMIACLAKYQGDSAKFVSALRAHGWLDGSLIHDWLDFAGEYLIKKYKTRRKQWLTATWAKHGRKYGRDGPAPKPEDGADGDAPDDCGKQEGSNREVNGKLAGSGREAQEVDLDQGVKALSPKAQTEEETKSPKGGLGEKAAGAPGSRAPPGFSNSSNLGFRAQGYKPLSESMPCEGFTEKEVFEALGTLFKFHSLFTVTDFHNKVAHCKVDAPRWAMVFLDKIHRVYKKDAEGKTLLDKEDADPVGMTVRGLVPKNGGPVHVPTDAARQFFGEIMVEYAKARAGEKARWNGNLSGPAVALELGRRKGKRGAQC